VLLAAIGCGHAAPGPCDKAKPEGPLAWIADDYPSALACAKARQVPIVIDLWAPWCHTCLSMQSTVFQDASFGKDRDHFVFLALDTDREVNAPALAKLSISAWPTFYVLGPDETVQARWIGAANVEQFHQFLSGQRDPHQLAAERALAVKDYATAETELTAALPGKRPEVLNALILTKWKRQDAVGCMVFAMQHVDEVGNSSLLSDFLGTAMACADARAKEDPVTVAALRERAVGAWQGLLADPKSAMSVDDRSDAMASLRETLEALGKKDDAHAIAEQQRALLDDAAAKATTPMAAMTYNWQRADVYVYLGRPLDLVPALEKSAKDLPDEYDPRARLGWVYWKAGKLDDAARWTDQALAMVYGPRKGRLLAQRAEIAKEAQDWTAERRYREDAVKLWESLPPSQQSPDALAKAKAALAATK
jgi:thiol-disulfide isomerase/thioredoxin